MTVTHKRGGSNKKYNENETDKETKFNWLKGKLRHEKRAKNITSHYSPILYGWMNTRNGKEKFNKFQILLDSWFSYSFIIVYMTSNIRNKNA